MPSQMFAPEYASEHEEIERRRRLAQALMERGMQPPQSTQAGGITVAPHPLQHAAGLAQMLAASRMQSQAGERQSSLSRRITEDRQKKLAQALQTARGGQPMMSQEDIAQNPFPSQTATQPNPMGAYSQLAGSGDPMLMQAGGTMLNLQAQQMSREEQREFQAQQAELQRQAIAAQKEADRAAATQRTTDTNLTREMIAGMTAANRPPPQPVAVVGPDGRPTYVSPDQAIGKQPYDRKSGQGLPPSALKMQNEMLEDIGIAASTRNDLAAISGQIAAGELNLGLLSNWMARGRNTVGLSNEQTRNFASFEATLEKLRNDSLRLNKGVQTEGDAVRAWNELLKNINDPGVVQQRLREIQTINERAVALKQLQIDQMRSNFGLEGLDTSAYRNQPPAIGDRRHGQRNSRTVVVDY